MTRREIILQILVEASGCHRVEEAEELLLAMQREGLIDGRDLEESFSVDEGQRMLGEFRTELPGIRRWLCETGILAAGTA